MAYPITQTGASGPLSVTTAITVKNQAGFPATAGVVIPSHIIITATGNGFRWRADGTAVSSTTGIQIGGAGSGGTLELTDPNFDYTSLIQRISICSFDGAATATVNVAYFAV